MGLALGVLPERAAVRVRRPGDRPRAAEAGSGLGAAAALRLPRRGVPARHGRLRAGPRRAAGRRAQPRHDRRRARRGRRPGGARPGTPLRRRPRTAPDPRPHPSAGAALATVGACVVMYATVNVLPVPLAASGTSTTGIAVVVGLAALGWVAGSAVTGGLVAKHGYPPSMLAGALALLISATLSATGELAWLAGMTAGIGTGAVAATTLALIQDQSPPEQLGVATSAATMLRNLGSAAGVNGIAALTAALATTPHQGQQNRAFWGVLRRRLRPGARPAAAGRAVLADGPGPRSLPG
ncbi:MFS transporter, partial [Streptomyces avermitilis]|uniref:MFS transporter n=1 Tax=Streptomyces avermitilis TaxID=33903 RepID=UPI0033B53ED4